MTENETTDESIGHEHDEDAAIEALTPEGQPIVLSEQDLIVLRQGRAELERSLSNDMGMPSNEEFSRMCQMAVMFAQAEGAPKDVKGQPFNAFLKLMTGRDLGLGVTASMRQIHTFDGNLTFAAELTRMLIERHNMGTIMPMPGNDNTQASVMPFGPAGPDKRCVRKTIKANSTELVHFEDPETGDCDCDIIGPPISFTWDDARQAGLVHKDCAGPTKHADYCVEKQSLWGKQRGSACKTNWFNYPQDMLYARASSACQRRYFAGATAGMYDPDEIGAVVDAQGNIIDLDSVELPPGYELPAGRTPSGRRKQEEFIPIAPEDLSALQVVIQSLSVSAEAGEDIDLGGGKTQPASERFAMVMDAWKTHYGVKAETLSLSQGEAALRRIKGMVPDWEARLAANTPETAPVSPPAESEGDGASEAADSQETPVSSEPEPVEGALRTLDPNDPEIVAMAQEAGAAPGPIREAIWAEVKEMQPQDVMAELAEADLPNSGKANELKMLLAAHRTVAKLNDPEHSKAVEAARELEEQIEAAQAEGDEESTDG